MNIVRSWHVPWNAHAFFPTKNADQFSTFYHEMNTQMRFSYLKFSMHSNLHAEGEYFLNSFMFSGTSSSNLHFLSSTAKLLISSLETITEGWTFSKVLKPLLKIVGFKSTSKKLSDADIPSLK